MKAKFIFLLTIMIFMILLSVNAQNSSIKIGVGYNSSYQQINYNSFTPHYLSWEAAFEKPLSKKWSLSLGFIYAVRVSDQRAIYNYKFINYDKMFVLEGRYYFYSTAKGPYIQLGVPVFSTKEVAYYNNGVSSFTRSHSQTGVNVYAGLGLKYPITTKWGVEFNISVTPDIGFRQDFAYGTDGYKKFSLKLMYLLNKRKEKL